VRKVSDRTRFTHPSQYALYEIGTSELGLSRACCARKGLR
jgi:hypothetical protein